MTESATADTSREAAPVRALVAMIHVADVERSSEFYRLLGFEAGNFVPRAGPKHWSWLYAPKARDWKTGPNLMLTHSEHPLNPEAQDVLFYLYATDMVALRNELLTHDVKVSEISYPWYLPKGEFRTQDPDGYCLMIAQSDSDSP